MGTYGNPKNPRRGSGLGDRGRSRHDGKVGWLGGRHRDRGTCGMVALSPAFKAISQRLEACT